MLLALLTLACAPKLPPAPAAENPLLLWRVERDGKASHLLGTCHLGVDLDYALPKPHDAALTGAKVVYTEAELDMKDPTRLVGLLWSEGPGLSERLPPDRWRAVVHAVRDTLPAPLLEHMEPWAVAMLVPMLLDEGGPSALEKTGMDQEIQRRARARGTPLAYVETIEEQARMLREWNDAFLESLGPSDAADDGAAEADALSELCFRADTRVADVLLDADDPTSEALIAARNRAWVPKLLPALTEGDAFVAVGAAHMLGEEGLLALLAAEGFTVAPLTTDRPASDAKMPFSAARVAPAPPLPGGFEALAAQQGAGMAGPLCADGQLLRTCFEPDESRCVERVAADTRLCLAQYADLLPADGASPSPALAQRVGTCAPSGLILSAIARDAVGDAPMCKLVERMMQQAGG